MPSNYTPATATIITTLPYTVTQDMSGAPPTSYSPECGSQTYAGGWWTYTPPSGLTAIGITVSKVDSGATYAPALSVWEGNLSSLAQFDECCYLESEPTHVRIRVTPGTPIYLLIVNNIAAVPDTDLILTVDPPPNLTVNAGDLLITSDIANQAAIVLDQTDGSSQQAYGLPSCEQGDFTPLGVLALVAEDPADANDAQAIELWDATLRTRTVRNTSLIVANQGSLSPIRCDHSHTFFVGCSSSSAMVVKTISDTGVVGGTTWTLPADSINAVSGTPTRDGATYYYAKESNNVAIHAYDLNGDAPLSDFVAAQGANTRWGRDLWVTADGDVLAMLCTNTTSDPFPWAVKRYNASGVLQTTYSIGTSSGSAPRIGLSTDSLSFWTLSFPGGGVNRLQQFVIAGGGSASVSFDVDQNDGAGAGPLWGPAQSCPLLVLPVAPPDPQGVITEVEPPNGECEISETQTITLTGVNFPVPPTLTVTDPNGTVTHPTPISATDTEIVFEIVVEVCGEWTFDVDGASVIWSTYRTHHIRCERTFGPIQDEQFWIFYHRFQLDLETGTTPFLTTYKADPTIMLSWSDDSGFTWSPEVQLSMGRRGQYAYRAFRYQLGRSRNRVWRIVISDPVPIVLLQALADISKGAS